MVRRRMNRRNGGISGRRRSRVPRSTRNNKIVSLRRRPRRNVPRRVPTLGYAAGGTSTTFRAFIKDFTIESGSALNDVYSFTINSALSAAKSYLSVTPALYTNFQIHRIVFRLISMVGSNSGGVHAACVFDNSMGMPSVDSTEYEDLVSRGGSTNGKLWSDLAVEWVPTSPDDLKFTDSNSKILFLAYAAKLPSDTKGKTILCKLVADITCVARCINTAEPKVLDMGNGLKGRVIVEHKDDSEM